MQYWCHFNQYTVNSCTGVLCWCCIHTKLGKILTHCFLVYIATLSVSLSVDQLELCQVSTGPSALQHHLQWRLHGQTFDLAASWLQPALHSFYHAVTEKHNLVTCSSVLVVLFKLLLNDIVNCIVWASSILHFSKWAHVSNWCTGNKMHKKINLRLHAEGQTKFCSKGSCYNQICCLKVMQRIFFCVTGFRKKKGLKKNPLWEKEWKWYED